MSKKIQIQITSDLHIERLDCEDIDILSLITPVCDTILLAGDIGSLYKYTQLRNFLKNLSVYFGNIIYVPGNCEYYVPENTEVLLKMSELKSRFKLLMSEVPGLTILDRGIIQIGNTCIAGCTLWSNPSIKIPRHIRIHKLTTDFYKFMFERDMRFVLAVIEHCVRNKLKLILATHYCPEMSLVEQKNPKFVSLYGTDLSHLFGYVSTWIYGHTHVNKDIIMNGTRLVSNQYGKKKESAENFSPSFSIIL